LGLNGIIAEYIVENTSKCYKSFWHPDVN